MARHFPHASLHFFSHSAMWKWSWPLSNTLPPHVHFSHRGKFPCVSVQYVVDLLGILGLSGHRIVTWEEVLEKEDFWGLLIKGYQFNKHLISICCALSQWLSTGTGGLGPQEGFWKFARLFFVNIMISSAAGLGHIGARGTNCPALSRTVPCDKNDPT